MSACGLKGCIFAAVYTTEHGPRCYGHRDVAVLPHGDNLNTEKEITDE